MQCPECGSEQVLLVQPVILPGAPPHTKRWLMVGLMLGFGMPLLVSLILIPILRATHDSSRAGEVERMSYWVWVISVVASSLFLSLLLQALSDITRQKRDRPALVPASRIGLAVVRFLVVFPVSLFAYWLVIVVMSLLIPPR